MSPEVLYEAEESVRGKCVCFLLVMIILWFSGFEMGLLVTGSPWTVPFIIATIMFALVGCFCVVGLVRGGTWYLQVNDAAVLWHGPLMGNRTVRHEDVEYFEYIVYRYNNKRGPHIRVVLKSGETVFLPDIGDQREVYRLLLRRWNWRPTDPI